MNFATAAVFSLNNLIIEVSHIFDDVMLLQGPNRLIGVGTVGER